MVSQIGEIKERARKKIRRSIPIEKAGKREIGKENKRNDFIPTQPILQK